MGLDITAYSRLRYLRPNNGDDYEDGTLATYMFENAFADRAAPVLPDSIYVVDGESFSFRAGSYSGYNIWRDTLARVMLSASAKEVWSNRADLSGARFTELINFSDCEGVIGSVAAAKLARDFAEWQKVADQVDDAYWCELYAKWRRAFELASNDGCVYFG